jgi:hypothetical protein
LPATNLVVEALRVAESTSRMTYQYQVVSQHLNEIWRQTVSDLSKIQATFVPKQIEIDSENEVNSIYCTNSFSPHFLLNSASGRKHEA